MTAEIFSTDPAKNDKPPPNGAPQGGLPLKRVSATLRVTMAGIADCWSAIKALKGMANQDPAAVAITGGTISGATIAGSSVILATAADTSKVFGRTVQQLYDLLYPIGEGRLFFNAAQPPLWPNVAASWQLVSAGRYLRSADPLDAGGTGGNTSVTTGDSGGHNHGGVTGDTAAVIKTQLGTDQFGSSWPFGTQQYATSDPHHHTIVAAPAHNHTVQLTPLFVDVAMYRRVS